MDQPQANDQHPATRLDALVRQYDEALSTITDTDAKHIVTEDTWSRIEELGHLVDSARMNYRRFADAPQKTDLIFEGYDQDAEVSRQKYSERSWADVLEEWHAANARIADLLRSLSDHTLHGDRIPHNFDVIGFRTHTGGGTACLDWLVEDYMVHMRYHLDKITAHQ